MLSHEFIANEIESLGLVVPENPEILKAIDQRFREMLFGEGDEYLGQAVMNMVDDAIFEFELPSIDDVDD